MNQASPEALQALKEDVYISLVLSPDGRWQALVGTAGKSSKCL
jgi:hypothetical protein